LRQRRARIARRLHSGTNPIELVVVNESPPSKLSVFGGFVKNCAGTRAHHVRPCPSSAPSGRVPARLARVTTIASLLVARAYFTRVSTAFALHHSSRRALSRPFIDRDSPANSLRLFHANLNPSHRHALRPRRERTATSSAISRSRRGRPKRQSALGSASEPSQRTAFGRYGTAAFSASSKPARTSGTSRASPHAGASIRSRALPRTGSALRVGSNLT